jgi:hypothetical protein
METTNAVLELEVRHFRGNDACDLCGHQEEGPDSGMRVVVKRSFEEETANIAEPRMLCSRCAF